MRVSFRLVSAALVVAFMIVAGVQSARSQCPAPGPITVFNNTTTNFNICLWTNPQLNCPFGVAGGTSTNVPLLVNTTVRGVRSFSGINYAWSGTPLSVLGVDLDGSGLCYDVVFTPNCTITVTLGGNSPCANP